MHLYNTLTKKIEEFKPLDPPVVSLYTCGPTVYDYTHLGHMRTYTNNDLLRRTLTYLGFKVNHVMNITDVGHLTGDNDSGEDKMEKGAKKANKSVWEVAEFYTDFFFKTTDSLNILRPNIVCKATDYIKPMIQLIKKLEKKGYTYQTNEALYFDVSKFPDYGKLSGQRLEEKIKGAREEVHIDRQKKHPADFALWFKRVGRFKNHIMHWDSPWGDGFPGWHIECSAMSMAHLGETIDIHTGGVDHIPVHHQNEIAQSEAATGKKFVRFWFHNALLQVEGKKMSKSLGNFYTLEDIKKRDIDPLAIRFLFLQVHYRQPMNFTWKAAQSSQKGLNKLRQTVFQLRRQSQRQVISPEKLIKIEKFKKEFTRAVSNDLQIPQAISIMWEMLKSNIPSEDKLDLLFDFDQIFGLKLSEVKQEKIPQEIKRLAEERLIARRKKQFKKADKIRKEIEKRGYYIEDTKEKYLIKKKH